MNSGPLIVGVGIGLCAWFVKEWWTPKPIAAAATFIDGFDREVLTGTLAPWLVHDMVYSIRRQTLVVDITNATPVQLARYRAFAATKGFSHHSWDPETWKHPTDPGVIVFVVKTFVST